MLAAAGVQAQAQTRDIVVHADANLRGALEAANNLFLFENAMRVAVSYATSTAQAGEIASGKVGDVFIADVKAMDFVAERKLVDNNTREDFLGDNAHPEIRYGVAILTSSSNVLASIYVQYLLSPKATPYFEKEGFVVY
jgi:ABC-type molybdate transport system substrate-binding protein